MEGKREISSRTNKEVCINIVDETSEAEDSSDRSRGILMKDNGQQIKGTHTHCEMM